ncbi:sensor histidine kinase [Nocardioides sp. GY 10127]|uniref:sensor histidine kinase n=1 Tax=Nocardioides sp. GY 10127 TaxID=2569762 RepID=UPI0010A85E2D|nr:sensor histidine kinase [Nocardioides sp. GY 10127]TIC84036.1 sensor histidine kinase [Nocardioides sp. GY 10127]
MTTRHGWALWSVWLLFLVFPVMDAWGSGSPLTRVVGLADVLAFAALYLWGVRSFGLGSRDRGSGAVLAGLVVLAAVAVWPLGLGYVSYLPYLVALGVFTLPRPWCFRWPFLVGLGLVAPWVLDPDEGWLVVSFIVVATGAGTSAGRLAGDTAAHARDLSQQLALTAERERVARDVHDVLGHSLTVVVLKAELAERLVDADPDRARAELAELRDLAREALAEVRSTVTGLRAADLDQELAAARTALEAAGVRADVPADGSALDPRRRPAAAWAVREAVTNVVRHAEARACAVELHPSGLRVADDGVGLAGSAPGNGLRGLRERVAATGGLLEVADAPGGGTVLEVSW